MAGIVRALTALLVALLPLAGSLASPSAARAASLDPALRDRAIGASVELAIQIQFQRGSTSFTDHFPLGSGTVISPDGIILTNAHLTDRDEQRATIKAFEQQLQAEYPDVSLTLDESVFVVLTSDGMRPPEPTFTAEVIERDPTVDLAVLQIVGDEHGRAFDRSTLQLPFLPLGNSGALGLGDTVHLFAYPGIADGALTYTTGVVSGFGFDRAIDGVAWIRTDAVMSGGSSGGTAVNDAGELIGIPTRGSVLDCRPGDTNGDGAVDANDVGCVPTGGSLGEIRPINLAEPILAQTLIDTGRMTEEELRGTSGSSTDASTSSSTSSTTNSSTDAGTSASVVSPTAEAAPADDWNGFDIDQTFDDVPDDVLSTTSDVTIRRGNGSLIFDITQPGGIDALYFNNAPTNDRDYGIVAEVAATSGWGEVLVELSSEADNSLWTVAVDPRSATWSMYRSADNGNGLFYWVNPRDYTRFVDGPLASVGLEVRGGVPVVLINGTDVSTPARIEMPRIAGSQVAGFGAGINPESLSGSGSSFSVEFERVRLYALS